jgi:hypothetical protein
MIIALGVVIGILEVWMFHPSWRNLLPSIAAGVVYSGLVSGTILAVGLVFGTFRARDPRSWLLFGLASALAGAAGGFIFWVLASPPTRPTYAALIGATLAVVVPFFENVLDRGSVE